VFKKSNGTNYEDWMELIKLFLAISCVEATLTKDEPPIRTDTFFVEEKMKYNKWAYSNKICMMTMKYSTKKTIKGNISEATNANKLLVDVGNNFKKFNRIQNLSYLSLLTKTKYDGVNSVREYAMKLTNWYHKLKFMEVVLGQDFFDVAYTTFSSF